MTNTAFELRNFLRRANISTLVSAETWCSKDYCDFIVHVLSQMFPSERVITVHLYITDSRAFTYAAFPD